MCNSNQLLKRRLLMVIFGAILLVSTSAPAAESEPQSWALLIGVEKYHHASRLRFTVNDVERLADTLVARGNFSEERILKFVDTETNPRFQPLRSSIKAELPKWLKKPGPQDTVLIFFSGHGFRDDDNKMYLAPIDCDPNSPAETGIPAQWFREQIAGCAAKNTILLLDSCHAGSEKGGDKQRVDAKQLGEPFGDLTRVVTIASSKGDELSQIWDQRQQSLFSYWVVQALKGHADRDNDNAVDIDELYKYVSRRVSKTAQTHFPRAQTPVRIVRSGVDDVPAVILLKPQRLQQVLDDMAEQLALAIEQDKLEKVGVLEFVAETQIGELLGANYGLLGKYCAEELERKLADYGEDTFRVVDRRRLQAALQKQQFQVKDLSSATAMEELSTAVEGMPILALGTLQNRAGRVINLQCKLLQTDSGDVVGSAAGLAYLNESEWAMLGRSAQLSAQDRIPPPPIPGETPLPEEEHLVRQLDEKAQSSHPLANADFDFPLQVVVDRGANARPRFEVRQGVAKGNDYYVPLDKGEVYQLWVESRLNHPVLMRLLVDGRNTLPEKLELAQRDQTKAMEVVGQRVNLDNARSFILDPESIQDPRKKKQWAVAGFYKKTGNFGEYNEFLVGDAANSPLKRTRFADQLGIITAVFYAPAGASSRDLVTLEGRRVLQKIKERGDLKPGELLSVVHIHYVEPSLFRSLSGR